VAGACTGVGGDEGGFWVGGLAVGGRGVGRLGVGTLGAGTTTGGGGGGGGGGLTVVVGSGTETVGTESVGTGRLGTVTVVGTTDAVAEPARAYAAAKPRVPTRAMPQGRHSVRFTFSTTRRDAERIRACG